MDDVLIFNRVKGVPIQGRYALYFFSEVAPLGAKCCLTEFQEWAKNYDSKGKHLFGNRLPWYNFKSLEKLGLLISERETDEELEKRLGGGRRRYYSITPMGKRATELIIINI